ncbi:hypothetical protein HDU82_001238 [Entophlyctis luteolus]|nr:hypothetical protein HDU82_001238 [Entophlyctis luteolus]
MAAAIDIESNLSPTDTPLRTAVDLFDLSARAHAAGAHGIAAALLLRSVSGAVANSSGHPTSSSSSSSKSPADTTQDPGNANAALLYLRLQLSSALRAPPGLPLLPGVENSAARLRAAQAALIALANARPPPLRTRTIRCGKLRLCVAAQPSRVETIQTSDEAAARLSDIVAYLSIALHESDNLIEVTPPSSSNLLSSRKLHIDICLWFCFAVLLRTASSEDHAVKSELISDALDAADSALRNLRLLGTGVGENPLWEKVQYALLYKSLLLLKGGTVTIPWKNTETLSQVRATLVTAHSAEKSAAAIISQNTQHHRHGSTMPQDHLDALVSSVLDSSVKNAIADFTKSSNAEKLDVQKWQQRDINVATLACLWLRIGVTCTGCRVQMPVPSASSSTTRHARGLLALAGALRRCIRAGSLRLADGVASADALDSAVVFADFVDPQLRRLCGVLSVVAGAPTADFWIN